MEIRIDTDIDETFCIRRQYQGRSSSQGQMAISMTGDMLCESGIPTDVVTLCGTMIELCKV